MPIDGFGVQALHGERAGAYRRPVIGPRHEVSIAGMAKALDGVALPLEREERGLGEGTSRAIRSRRRPRAGAVLQRSGHTRVMAAPVRFVRRRDTTPLVAEAFFATATQSTLSTRGAVGALTVSLALGAGTGAGGVGERRGGWSWRCSWAAVAMLEHISRSSNRARLSALILPATHSDSKRAFSASNCARSEDLFSPSPRDYLWASTAIIAPRPRGFSHRQRGVAPAPALGLALDALAVEVPPRVARPVHRSRGSSSTRTRCEPLRGSSPASSTRRHPSRRSSYSAEPYPETIT